VPVDVIVEKVTEMPAKIVIKEIPIEAILEKEVIIEKETIVERIIELPVVIKEVPVEVYIEKEVII
jgi:hypothetical protein